MMRLVSDLILLAIRFVLLHSINPASETKIISAVSLPLIFHMLSKSRSKFRFVALRWF